MPKRVLGPMPGRRLSFGPFAVDGGSQVVLRDGAPLSVGIRGVRLLEALLRRPGEVLTKAELMDAAWPGTAVEESNLSVQMAALRKALADGAGERDWIATVPRVGYRFVGPAAPGGAEQAHDDRRTIAVLPFRNLSNDPEQAFFADGLAEEIITALSRLPGLLVIARNSSFAYRGDGIDLRLVGHELEVQYLVTGSVRRSGDRLRMGVQLADAEAATQLWAETYDRQLTDILSVQDDVTRQVVAALGPRLQPQDRPASSPIGTDDMEALDLFLKGRGLLSSPALSRAVNAEGIALLRRAIERDPAFGRPYPRLAIGLCTARSSQWSDDPEGDVAAARTAADRGLDLLPDDGEAHGGSALVAMMEKNHDRLRTDTARAIALNPNSGVANILRAAFLVNDGQPLAAIPLVEHAIRMDPAMTHLYIHHLGTAYLAAGRYETAAALFRSRIQLFPTTDMSRAYLCVALGHLGHREEARQIWSELMAITPNYSLSERLGWWHYEDPAFPARLLDGLRLAGLPTGENES